MKTSFCVICTDGDMVVKKAFFKSEECDRTVDIAVIVAGAAYKFNSNDFDVFIINLDD